MYSDYSNVQIMRKRKEEKLPNSFAAWDKKKWNTAFSWISGFNNAKEMWIDDIVDPYSNVCERKERNATS